jgi:hypothetical protein
MKKLTVLASLSGGGKSTYANANYQPEFIFPDTNVKVYEIYNKLFRHTAINKGLEPDKLTGLTLWSAKYSADMAYLNTISTYRNEFEFHDYYGGDWDKGFINMRSGFDYLIYDELWQNRIIIPEDEMHKLVLDIESQFDEVEYKILVMKDEKIIKELMDRNDDRSSLFNHDPIEYHRWQNYYVKRYIEILDKYDYKYSVEEVIYT